MLDDGLPTFKCVETTTRGKQEVFWGGYPFLDGERSLQGRCVVVNGDIRAIKAAEFMTKGKPQFGDYVGFQFYAPGEGR